MKTLKITTVIFAFGILTLSCNEQDPNNPNRAQQVPIDSSNLNGAAPVKYSGSDPAHDSDNSKQNNYNDTGTKASNVHNTGYDSVKR